MATSTSHAGSQQRDHVSRARELATQLRIDSLRCSTRAGSGHPTSSLSAADLMAVLLSRYLRWDLEHPEDAGNDHLIFSKGHASPLLYSMFKAAGVLSDDELLGFRRFGSPLQGHPVPSRRLPWVDVATGSLGQGLPIGVGVALAGKYLEKVPYRVWVLLGDGEMSEGSIWEALDHARHYRLTNLTAVLDMNRLGQRGETPLGWDSAAYAVRARAFGWRALEIDGHDHAAIAEAFDHAVRESEAPTLVVARTIKGKGVPMLEDRNGWHGKALDEAQCRQAVARLGGVRQVTLRPPMPDRFPPTTPTPRTVQASPPRYERGAMVATRKAYGEALASLGSERLDVVALDGEVSNSTYAEDFAKAHPARFFEMFISEQQMIAAAVGLAARGLCPFASSFGAFMTRAFDFVRMAAVSGASIKLCGSHAGVSIGEDGPSQMALEDLAMMRAVHGSTVLYPSCANQAAALTSRMADIEGIVYLRTTREKTPVLYDPSETFERGGSKVLRRTGQDQVTIVAAGITVHEALRAHERLRERGVTARVVDAYSIKPIDGPTLRASARATGGNVVVVEDHWAEGGLGDAVMAVLGTSSVLPAPRVAHLAVRGMPGSGAAAELLHAAAIDADAIVLAALDLVAAEAVTRSPTAIAGTAPGAPRCFVCGRDATWRILVAGEDDPATEEDACDLHARGHLRHVRLPAPSDRAPRPPALH